MIFFMNISFSGGHCLLVGSLGSELVALAKLSLYIARFNYHKVDCSNMKVFDESMRGLYRLSGLEGQPAATVFTVSVCVCVCACLCLYVSTLYSAVQGIYIFYSLP